ncbi:LOW QUALITY PROTEIN: hypothetical protein ACHAXR_007426 [Thalassiosira sp. AJA248-18]
MGYAYATTVLSTHFIEGSVPPSLAKFRPDKLTASSKESMDWVREALNSKDIYPVNPNLVLSTDDTTLFVFDGANNESDDWAWKLIDSTNGNSSVRSDFEVKDDVKLTFTFTASGLAAPPYVAVSGLTEKELDPVLCPDGILATKVRGLCKGGDDLFNEGIGWLVFLRADKKDKSDNNDDNRDKDLSIANKKFMQYNDDVLLPFIRAIREKLGWKKGQTVPDSLKAVSWFDGDIGQLQTMLFEAREALDLAEQICRNKHSAAATGTQQPCDLSPVFRLLKQLQKKATAKDDTACGLANDIDALFSIHLRSLGLNLDGNRRKKKALIDFLLCLPELLEAAMKKKHIKNSFIEAGMIDAETGMVPTFDKLIGTCKRWVSSVKNIGVPMEVKDHCKKQFQALMKIQIKEGQISYPDMKEVGIPLGAIKLKRTDPPGHRLSVGSPRRQSMPMLNKQQEKRAQLRRTQLAEAHRDKVVACNLINEILKTNKAAEEELQSMTESGSIADATVANFLSIKVSLLQDFIHARKFDNKTFLKAELSGTDGKLNKTRYKTQTAESIEKDCSETEPCLVWLAWKLRSEPIILKERQPPVLNSSLPTPKFTVIYYRPDSVGLPSDFLRNPQWVDSVKSVIRGVDAVLITEEMMLKANKLALALEPRLTLHISDRVDPSRQNHWTLRFTHDNIPPMAAAMCLFGHVVDDIDMHRLDERLLNLPMQQMFKIVTGDLSALEGCYLYYDNLKHKWIRSGKSSGDGKDACFLGRGKKHNDNARSKDQMRVHRFYRDYPARGVENLGAPEGHFENLVMYCGMAYDKKCDVKALCSDAVNDGLFVWSLESISEMKRKGGDLKEHQLDAVAYLWEICYDLLLAKGENVSKSPGFEVLGLRVNNDKKRK